MSNKEHKEEGKDIKWKVITTLSIADYVAVRDVLKRD